MKSKIINLDFNDNIDLIKATVDKLQNQVQHWNSGDDFSSKFGLSMQSKPSILEYKNFQDSLDKLNNFSTILGTFLDVQGKEEAEVADLADRLEKVK